MPEQWYAVYRTSDNVLVSTGTLLPEELPEGLAALPLDEAPDFAVKQWNKTTRLLDDRPPPPPPPPLASDEIMAIPEIAALSAFNRSKIKLAVRRVVP